MLNARLLLAFVFGALSSLLGVAAVGEALAADAEQSVAAFEQTVQGTLGAVRGLFERFFLAATQSQ